jgi:cytochrome c-type biogenesis protein CcmE
VRKRYVIGGGILVLAVGLLIYVSLGSSFTYYFTVNEFLDRSSEFCDRSVRVAGKIADEPISWNAEDLELRFTIFEDADTLPVVYEGAKPSGFKVSANILVEGRLDSDGVFHASQVLMKCPSKYVPEE